ncbi:MAG: hypothetical protein NZ866_01175 [Patescibacteria group bacterium]|nr:hypothetical protein [Patescibacteria group bacterium]
MDNLILITIKDLINIIANIIAIIISGLISFKIARFKLEKSETPFLSLIFDFDGKNYVYIGIKNLGGIAKNISWKIEIEDLETSIKDAERNFWPYYGKIPLMGRDDTRLLFYINKEFLFKRLLREEKLENFKIRLEFFDKFEKKYNTYLVLDIIGMVDFRNIVDLNEKNLIFINEFTGLQQKAKKYLEELIKK